MNNLKEILITKPGGKAATRFVRRIGLLDQFRAAVMEQRKEEQEREEVQEREGKEGKEGGKD